MIFSSKINTLNILIYTWTILFLLLVPSIFGAAYNKELFIALVLMTIFIVYHSKNHFVDISVNKIILFLILLANVLYFLIQGLILSTSISTVLNSSLFIGALIPLLFVMSSPLIQQKFIDCFISIHFILALSAVISIFLLIFYNLDQLSYSEFRIKDYSSRSILFPFTVYWSKFNHLWIPLPRMSGIYKEPGLAQAFFLTAFWLSVVAKKNVLTRSILFLGALLTFSGAGMFNILISFAVFIGIGQRLFTIIIRRPIFFLVIFTVLAIVFSIGYPEIKRKANSLSGKERFKSYTYSLETLKKNPIWGTGYYSSRKVDGTYGDVQELGLLGAAYQLGYFGLILYLGVWAFSIIIINKGAHLYVFVPFLTTLLFFQPNYNDPIIWLLLTLNIRKIEFN